MTPIEPRIGIDLGGTDAQWHTLERYLRVGDEGPEPVSCRGYPVGRWAGERRRHARIIARTGSDLAPLLEWSRPPGDRVFIVFGIVPIVIARLRALRGSRASEGIGNVP